MPKLNKQATHRDSFPQPRDLSLALGALAPILEAHGEALFVEHVLAHRIDDGLVGLDLEPAYQALLFVTALENPPFVFPVYPPGLRVGDLARAGAVRVAAEVFVS